MHIVHEHRLDKHARSLLSQAVAVGESIATSTAQAAAALCAIAQAMARVSSPTRTVIEGGQIVKTIPDNTPDIRFDISPVSKVFDVDAEGHRIPGSEIDPSNLSYPIEVDDADGLEVIPDPASAQDAAGNPMGGWLRVGAPNEDSSPRLVNVVFKLESDDGTLLANLGGEQYNVTVGGAAGKAVQGGGVTIGEPPAAPDAPATGGGTTPGGTTGGTTQPLPEEAGGGGPATGGSSEGGSTSGGETTSGTGETPSNG